MKKAIPAAFLVGLLILFLLFYYEPMTKFSFIILFGLMGLGVLLLLYAGIASLMAIIKTLPDKERGSSFWINLSVFVISMIIVSLVVYLSVGIDTTPPSETTETNQLESPYNQIKELEKELKENPNNVEAHFMLGQVYSSSYQRRYEEALKEFRRTVEIDPSFAKGYFWLGNTYETLQRHEEALAAFEKAIGSGMNTAMVYAAAAGQFHLMEASATIDERFFTYGEKAIELGCKEGDKKECLRYLANFLNIYLSFKLTEKDLTRIEEYINKAFSLIGSDISSKKYNEFVQLLGVTYYNYPNAPEKWEQAIKQFDKAQVFFTEEQFPYEHDLINRYKTLLEEKEASQKYLVNEDKD